MLLPKGDPVLLMDLAGQKVRHSGGPQAVDRFDFRVGGCQAGSHYRGE